MFAYSGNGLSNILFGLTEFITGSSFFFWACLTLRILEAFGCISHITASYTFVIKKFPDDISYVFSLTESCIGKFRQQILEKNLEFQKQFCYFQQEPVSP